MVKKINALLLLPDLAASKPLAWPALYAVLVAITMGNYLHFHQPNFWLGIIAIVIFTRFPRMEKGNFRFLYSALASIGLFLVIPVQTFFYFALVCMLLFSIEAITGKLQGAIIPVVLLMSPMANYAAEAFSIPIRLQLTQWAVKLLSISGNTALAHGNSIAYNGATLDVDHSFVGLSMLVGSLLMALISIQLVEAKYHRRLPFVYVALALFYFAIANVVANLFRIIFLVYFQIAPDTFIHEIVTILSWMIIGILPCILLVKAMVIHLGQHEYVVPLKSFRFPTPAYHAVVQLCMLAALSLLPGFITDEKQGTEQVKSFPYPGQGYSIEHLPHGFEKYQNGSSVVHVKSMGGFYSIDHNPSKGWQGSGYIFTNVRNAKRGQTNLYMAKLEKEDSTLYTAWWYEHAKHRTNNPFIWRYHNLKNGRDYRLVNITASSQEDLEIAIEKWIETN